MSRQDAFDRARERYEAHKKTLPYGLVALFDVQVQALRKYDEYVLRNVSNTNVIALHLKEDLDWYNNLALWVKEDPEGFNAAVLEYVYAMELNDRTRILAAYDQLEMLRKLKGLEVKPDVPIYPLM